MDSEEIRHHTIKAVIFDYGRTLYDRENGKFFPEAKSVLDYLSRKYVLAIVSIAKEDPAEERVAALKKAGLYEYFSSLMFHESDKGPLFEDTLKKLNVKPDEIAVVDDRVKRGIAWGNNNGAITIWLRRGKFADELPDAETGKPTYVIGNLIEIKNLL